MPVTIAIVAHLLLFVFGQGKAAYDQAEFREYFRVHGSIGLDYQIYLDGSEIRQDRWATSSYPAEIIDFLGVDLLHRVVYVDVHPSRDGDEVIDRVSRQPTIIHVGLSGCRRTSDDAIALLQRLPDLISLELDNSHFSDACIEHLCGLENLRFLDVSNSKISDHGLNDLRERLPDCHIKYGDEK